MSSNRQENGCNGVESGIICASEVGTGVIVTPENGNGAHVAEKNALCPAADRKTGAMAWKVG